MKTTRILVLLLVLVSVIATLVIAEAGKPLPPPPTAPNLVVGRPAKGMYCADPAGWINAGYKIFVWGNATPVKAQAIDDWGFLISPNITWTVQGTGETGTMTAGTTAIEIDNKIFVATPKSARADMIFTGDTNITYSADGKSFSGVIRRWNSKCDGCHSVPPPHALANAATTPGVSTCRSTACHADFGSKMMQSHAYRVTVAEQTTSDGCYRCHPSPCYGGIHKDKFPNDAIGCVTCHGSLADGAVGQGKWPGQLGFPKCEDCHVSVNRQPVPYAVGAEQYKNAVGHGRLRSAKALCITCHNSMHMETKPMSWGDGVNNNCQVCHKNMPAEGNMGPVCGNCHVDSFNPHLVIK